MVNSSEANANEPGKGYLRRQRHRHRGTPGAGFATFFGPILVMTGCAPAVAVEGPSIVTVVARTQASIGPEAGKSPVPCVVAGKGDPASWDDFDIFASASEPDAIAVVRVADEVPLRFESWPSYESGGRAAVVVSGNGAVKMNGFVELSKRHFQLKRRVELVGPQVFADTGTIVSVRGAHHGGLFVDVPTPFAEPTKIGLAVPCDGVVYQPAPLSTRTGPRVESPMLESREAMLTFFDAPHGRAILQAKVGKGRLLSVLEEKQSFVHVRLGNEPDFWFDNGTLLIDAWVRRDDVGTPTPSDDRESHCGPPDRYDRCNGGPRIKHDTPLRLGSTGPAIGVAEAGAYVETGERADGHVAITFSTQAIVAPREKQFFVSEEAIEPCRGSADGSADGCPCEAR